MLDPFQLLRALSLMEELDGYVRLAEQEMRRASVSAPASSTDQSQAPLPGLKQKVKELTKEEFELYRSQIRYLDAEFDNDSKLYLTEYRKIVEKLFGETLDNDTQYVVRYVMEEG